MSEWIDLIDDCPEVSPIDERNDWHFSEEIRVMDTLGNECIATYYVKRDICVEEWWDCDNDEITTSLIRYWKPIEEQQEKAA
jgi:hypothetical protein